MEQQTVTGPGRHRPVEVYQVAKHVWIADGEVFGNQLRARGNTAGKALIAWRKAAVKRASDSATSFSYPIE